MVLSDYDYQCVWECSENPIELYGRGWHTRPDLEQVWKGIGKCNVDEPDLKVPDVFPFLMNCLVFSEDLLSDFEVTLKQSGLILPIDFSAQRGQSYLYVCTFQQDEVVDTDASTPRVLPGGGEHGFTEWVFRPDAFSMPGLFRHSEDVRLFAMHDDSEPHAQDFVAVYEKLGLEGLELKRIWLEGCT